MSIHAKRGVFVGALVFVALLAVFIVTGTVEPWIFVVVCAGAFALGYVLTPYLD